MSGLNFDLEKQGFPVKIGGIEFWFDDSPEAMRDFVKRDRDAQIKLIEIDKQIESHPPIDSKLEIDKIDAVFELKKKSLKIQYDNLLGDGAFDKIYEKYPDMKQLEQLMIPIDKALGEHIEKRLKEYEDERQQLVESRRKEYLSKKAKKK